MIRVPSTEGGHEMVGAGGEGVLVLRPAIGNLDLNTPATMTLYLEHYDGETEDIIARIIDPEAADNAGIAQVANRVTNTANFDRVLRSRAEMLCSC